MSITEVFRKNEERLLKLPNVVHAGIGFKDGKEIILVFVSKKINESELAPEALIPKNIEGFETSVQLEIKVG